MTRRRHIINGLYWGYPICCILRWTFGRHGDQGTRRGSNAIPFPQGTNTSGCHSNRYVKCGIFHR